MDDDNKTFFIGFFGGILLGILICCLFLLIINPIMLSQETGNEICQQFTGNENAVADVGNGNLICEIPSFDETQNIIIRRNNE